MKFILHVKEFFTFTLHHPGYGYSRPAADHLSNIVRGNLFPYESSAPLSRFQLCLNFLDVIIQLVESGITDFCDTFIIAFPFSLFSLIFELFDLLFVLLDLIDEILLAFPFSPISLILIFQVSKFLVKMFNLRLVIFPLDSLPFNFQLFDVMVNVIQLFRDRVTLQAEFGSSLIHQVNGLVRKIPVINITFREFYGSDAGIILNADLMVIFITFLQAPQDRDGIHLTRFIDHDCLETAFQSLIFLKVFLIFIQRSRADRPQFPT